MLMNPGPASSTFSTNGDRCERIDQRLGDVARRAPGTLGQREGHVRREVAVFLLPGCLQLGRGQLALQLEAGRCRPQPVGKPSLEFGLDHAPSTSVRTVATSATVSKGFCT